MWYSGLERWYPLRYTETLRHHVRHLVSTLTMCLGGIWRVRDNPCMQEDGGYLVCLVGDIRVRWGLMASLIKTNISSETPLQSKRRRTSHKRTLSETAVRVFGSANATCGQT